MQPAASHPYRLCTFDCMRGHASLRSAGQTLRLRSGQAACTPTQIAQIPAYQAYPPSGEAEPKPLPNGLSVSVRVRRVMYLTFL